MSDIFYSELPTADQVNSIIRGFESADKSASEATAYRMQNYFDCVDDYSWGGPCDQAQAQGRSLRQRCKARLLSQIENGGAFIDTFCTAVLCDLQGNILSEKIVDGRYGPCWIIGSDNNVSFVGVAKKAATYEKKGYRVMTRQMKVEYYFTGKIINGSCITKGRVLSNDVINEFPPKQDTHINSIAYFAN